MRLIDADALMFYVRQHLRELYPKDGAMIDAILVAPTVDAVEVVRCKDCRFSHMTYSGECKSCDKWVDDDDFHLTLYLNGDFYCAFGERKDETD